MHKMQSKCTQQRGRCQASLLPCKKRGHFEEHCFFRKMGKASTIEVSLNGAFLYAVGINTEKCWMASVTVSRHSTFKMVQNTLLKQQEKNCVVLFKLPTFTSKLDRYQDDIYVVRELRNNLLGLPAIAGIQLVQRICSTEAESDIKKRSSMDLEHFGQSKQSK